MKTIKNLTADEIRKSILQLAIQGKLVKQDPNDEPASELVKRIYEEKDKLIKKGKLKKDKNESYIFKGDDNCYYEKVDNEVRNITAELPFDIPSCWTWIRLSSYCYLNGGYAFKSSYFSNEGIRVVRISDFDEFGIKNKEIKRYPYSHELDKYKIEINDIIICMTGGTVGKSLYVKCLNEPTYINQRVALIRTKDKLSDYLAKFLSSPYIQSLIKDNITSTNDNISMEFLNNILIPLPPLKEQLRIISKINFAESLILIYQTKEENLSELENNFEDKLKASILQYAVEGKLVKQNPNDEPASVLLKRIKEEKERLIREGKIKREKYDSTLVQTDDKNYYENIPNGWTNSKLSFVINLVSGVDLSPSEYSSENIGIPYITGASNFHDGHIVFSRYTKDKYINSQKGDILLTCKGTIGEIAFNDIGNCHVARQIMSIKSFINPEFLAYWLLAKRKQLISSGKSIIPGIDRKTILESHILIPPLLEEKRISEKLDASFTLIQSS